MIIYRIQLPNGQGPHRNDNNYQLEEVMFEYADYEYTTERSRRTHPTPVEAFSYGDYEKFRKSEDYIFGFRSMDEYKNWTINDAVRENLKENGFKLQMFVIDYDNLLLGRSQIAFKLSDTVKLETLECA